jgi:hypothetical protein
MSDYPTTPDGRYFVVGERLWRCSDPSINAHDRRRLVDELMAARRAVLHAKRADDAHALKSARARVNAAKVTLGERGPVWWHDLAPDFNRHNVHNTPYQDWYRSLSNKP